jgi:hypothetical protein
MHAPNFLSFSSIYFCHENIFEDSQDFNRSFDYLIESKNVELGYHMAHIPKFYVYNIMDTSNFYKEWHSKFLENDVHVRDIFVFMLFNLKSKVIRNCYTRAEMINCVSKLVSREQVHDKFGYYIPYFSTGEDLFNKYLLPILMQAYVDLETTDCGNKFTDKDSYRNTI